MTDTRKFIMEARRSKKKNASGDSAKRSRFLSAIMPQLAGDSGKAMADAIEGKNLEKFSKLWDEATHKIINNLKEKFKEGEK